MQSYQLWWLFFEGEFMRLYEVDESYINYLKLFEGRVLNYSGDQL